MDQEKKLEIKNNEDQIKNIIPSILNWVMKLKTNKTFTKGSRQKIRNPKNKDQIEKYNIW